MLNAKKIGFCMIFVLSFILISSSIFAAQQVTLSNIKIYNEINGLRGIELVPISGVINNPDGTKIAYGQNIYVEFDATATGDSPISGSSFFIYSPNPTRSPYLQPPSTLKYDLAAGATIHISIKTSFLSNFCPEQYGLVINSPGSTIPFVNNNLGSKIDYAGGPDCALLDITSFNFLPQHPAYINQSSTTGNEVFGFEYTIKNMGSAFSGTYELKARNIFINDVYSYQCTKTGSISLAATGSAGDEVIIRIDPSDISDQKCPVGAQGYIYLTIKNANNVQAILGGLNFFYIYRVDIPSVGVIDTPYLDKLSYAPGETATVYHTSVVDQRFSPLAKPILAGSVFHYWVKDSSSGALLNEGFFPVTQELPLKSKFGIIPGISYQYGYYYLGPVTFTFDPTIPVPERIDYYFQLNRNDGSPIFQGDGFYGAYKKNIALKSLLVCNTAINKGCSCSSALSGPTYTVTCSLQKTGGITILKNYAGRFIFNQILEPQLQRRLTEITTNPSELLGTLDFSNSIQFDTVPQPDSTTTRTYTFDFNCDLDKDSYLDPACGGNDCNDNNALAYPGAQETCDNLDNDCNALTGDGSNEAWYNMQTPECGTILGHDLGICAGTTGTYTCLNGLKQDNCAELVAQQAQPENCPQDGLDNNCDGTVDNINCKSLCDVDVDSYYSDNLNFFQSVYCSLLFYSSGDCNDNNNLINPGSTEIPCNGIDENCNTADDLGTDNDQDTYTVEDGLCGLADCADSILDCSNLYVGTLYDICSANLNSINPSSTERCNGIDDDCDNSVDETFNVGQECTIGAGVCQSTGRYVCNADALGTSCDAVPGIPITEICINGLDDDCNGLADDGCSCSSGQTQPCYDGNIITRNVGICSDGSQTCVGGLWGTCASSITPNNEICDGLDNDCNGLADDNLGTATCGDGICSHTINNCENGIVQSCDPMQGAIGEICKDGLDNDCNGLIDDGCICSAVPIQETQVCYSGDQSQLIVSNGICQAGIQVCNNGKWDANCLYEVLPMQEICDGLDNNCDGTIDEGVKTTYYKDADGDGYGDPLTSAEACAQPGDYVTNNLDCNDNNNLINPGSIEIPCNGINENCNTADDLGTDNDQDTYTVEGNLCGLQDCADSITDCSNLYTEGTAYDTCIANLASIHPGAQEICSNGIDDDCDGIDTSCECTSDTSEACYTGTTGTENIGPCKGGAKTCIAGMWGGCFGEVLPIAEICGNGIDEDCDGADEVCVAVACTATSDYEICGNGIDDNCDTYTDSLPQLQLINNYAGTAPTNLDVLNSGVNSITLKLTADGVPVQGVAVCVGSCNPAMIYAEKYTFNEVTFDTPFGITSASGEISLIYNIANAGEYMVTFKTLSDAALLEIQSQPVSFSLAP